MQIFIQKLTGKTISLTVEPTDSIKQFKEMIQAKEGFPPEQQRRMSLIYGGKELADDMGYDLAHYDIQRESTIYMCIRIGGPPGPGAHYDKGAYDSGIVLTPPFERGCVMSCQPDPFIVTFRPSEINGRDLAMFLGSRSSDYCNLWHDYTEHTKPNWTMKFIPQRIVLLKLSEEFSCLKNDALQNHIDEVRYCCLTVNKSYYGGDHRSWQRYTDVLPLELKLETGDCCIKCTPLETLQPNTAYALVLLHTGINSGFMVEDYLYHFRTKPMQYVTLKSRPEILADPTGANSCKRPRSATQLNLSKKKKK